MPHPIAPLVLALALTMPAGATEPPGAPPASTAPITADRLVRAEVTADVPRVAPGQRFHLAVTFRIAPQWHIYWENPGDSGAPTEIDVSTPEGFRVDRALYPRPQRFREADMITYGYEKEVTLFVPVTAPVALAEPSARFDLDIFFLVCRERCLIGRAKRSLTLPVATDAAAVPTTLPPPLERQRRRVPTALADVDGATARIEGERLVVDAPAGAHAAADFFPLLVPGVEIGPATTRVREGRVRVEAPIELSPQNAEGGRWSVRGVLSLGDADGPSYHFDVPLPPPTPGG